MFYNLQKHEIFGICFNNVNSGYIGTNDHLYLCSLPFLRQSLHLALIELHLENQN